MPRFTKVFLFCLGVNVDLNKAISDCTEDLDMLLNGRFFVFFVFFKDGLGYNCFVY